MPGPELDVIADRAAVRRTDRGANRGDLVLGLEHADAQVAVARELMQQRRRGRDRIGAEDDLAISELAGGRKPERERLAAAHAAILARRELCDSGADVRHGRGELCGLTVGVPRAQRREVRVADRGVLRELLADPIRDRRDLTIEHPLHEPEGPEVLAAARVALAETERLRRVHRELRDVDLDDLVAVEHAALARVGLIARFREAAGGEAVDIEDDQRAVGNQRQIDLERGRVERDEHVRRVAGRRDRPRPEVNLICRDAERRADRRADLRGEIGERREIVADERSRRDELGSHQLHAVAGVAGETDHD